MWFRLPSGISLFYPCTGAYNASKIESASAWSARNCYRPRDLKRRLSALTLASCLATQQQRGLSEGTVGRNRLSTNAAPVSVQAAWERTLTIGKSLASLLVRHGLHPNIDGHALRLLRRQNP